MKKEDPYTFEDWENAKARGHRIMPKKEAEKKTKAQKNYYWEGAVKPLS